MPLFPAATWADANPAEGGRAFSGTAVGGTECYAYLQLQPDFGYALPDDLKVTINGKDGFGQAMGQKAIVFCPVKADHDWGEWEVVTKPTTEAEGLGRRTCKHCDEFEERAIPKLVIKYSCTKGDGATFTKGSGTDLEFTFERDPEPKATFDHYVSVEVDGQALSADDFTAEPGSVNVTLKASYLEKLSAGKHTLKVTFDDGEATATFTVADKAQTTPDSKPKIVPKTGEAVSLVGAFATLGALALAAGKKTRRK